jgi:D-glycero-D-manno-heptose 1,7-bisphosphate phosphatase
MNTNKAIFLDRDGIINKERGEYTYRMEDFLILPDVAEVLSILQRRGFLLIVITNQGGIAKGIYTAEEVRVLHNFMKNELEKFGVHLSAVYFCPHHPDFGNCLCRKPNSSMLERAIARFKIDVSASFLVGDKPSDVEAGERVGIKSYQLVSNSSLRAILDLISTNDDENNY